jgi:hypothetical protein
MNASLVSRFAALFFALTVFVFAGCYYDNEQELYPDGGGSVCDTANVSYASTVLPILRDQCYVCHAEGVAFGNVVLEGHANMLVYVNNGRLYGSIAHQSGFSAMPQGRNKLPDCQLAQIKSWIDAGALNN